MKQLTYHNWNEFEQVKNDLAVASLKLHLVYGYIVKNGFTLSADLLLAEAVSMIDEQQKACDMFFDCVEDGLVFNPELDSCNDICEDVTNIEGERLPIAV